MLEDYYLSKTEQAPGSDCRVTFTKKLLITSDTVRNLSECVTMRQLAFFLENGKLPSAKVLATCGNKLCCAKKHMTVDKNYTPSEYLDHAYLQSYFLDNTIELESGCIEPKDSTISYYLFLPNRLQTETGRICTFKQLAHAVMCPDIKPSSKRYAQCGNPKCCNMSHFSGAYVAPQGFSSPMTFIKMEYQEFWDADIDGRINWSKHSKYPVVTLEGRDYKVVVLGMDNEC